MAVGHEEFFKRLEESGLLNDSIVEQKDRLRAVSSGEEAAADLVSQKLLTAYQSEVLLSGEDVPLVLGDYEVTDSIGRGGMGYVLKACHRRMKRTVAIKFLLKSLTDSDDLRRRFEREVEAAAQLDHQNIVTAYDAGVHEGSHFLVMQYVDGEDLSHLVKSSGPLDIPDAVDVIRQAALGLGYAHDRGIIHRDIKPGNLLLDNEGVVRILDMGLARIMPSPGDALEGGAQADLTNTGSVMGTIDYMAPEQALDAKSVDHRTDIYALGCTLYFLLTSNPPFRNETVMRRLLAHREQPAPRISEYRPDAPRELDDIFATMMAKSPDDRFPSMKHVVVALDSLELTDSEDEQMATLNMPDDGSGGFVPRSEGGAFGIPNPEVTFDTPDRTSVSNVPADNLQDTRPFIRQVDPSQTGSPVFDATFLETVGQDALPASPSGGGNTASLDTEFSGIGNTIITNSASLSDDQARRQGQSQPSWKRIVPAVLAVIMLIAFLATRPDSSTDPTKPAAPTSTAAEPSEDVLLTGSDKPDSRPNGSPTRLAAERILAWGGTVSVQLMSGQYYESVRELPEESFRLIEVKAALQKATDDDLTYLQGLASLTRISISDTEISDRGLSNLTDSGRVPLPSLRALRAHRLDISDKGIGYLAGSSALEILSIQGTKVSDLEHVCRTFPRIRNFDFSKTSMGGESLAHLKKLSNLQHLAISGDQLRNGGSEHVAELTGLKELIIYDSSEGFEPAVLTNLSELERLEVIGLTNRPRIGEEFWSIVNTLQRLEKFSINGWGVSSGVVDQIPTLSQLRTITISNSQADGEAIANAAKRLPRLETLNLDYNGRLDEDGLTHLATLTGIKRLGLLGNSKLPAAAVESLHKALPNCQIISDHGTFEPVSK